MVVGTKPAIRNDLILAWRVLVGGQPGTDHADNGGLTLTTVGCHTDGMAAKENAHHETIQRIKEVRAQAIEHTRQARRLAAERRDLIQGLIADGWSQADVGRELGVSRQAIQKMLAC